MTHGGGGQPMRGAKCGKWLKKPFIEIKAKMVVFFKIRGDVSNERTK